MRKLRINYCKSCNLSLRKRKDKRAISPIIATVLITSILASAIAIGIVYVVPYAQRTSAEASLTQGINIMQDFDAAIYKCAFFDNPDSPIGQQIVSAELGGGKLELLTLGESQEFYLQIDGINQDSFLEDYGKGYLRYSFASDSSLIETTEKYYLSGESDPYIQRPEIITEQSDDRSLTNITLTRAEEGNTHYVNLGYRTRLFVEEGVTLSLKLISIEMINNLGGILSGEEVTIKVEAQPRQILTTNYYLGTNYSLGYSVSLYGIFNDVPSTDYIYHVDNSYGFTNIQVTVLKYRVEISEHE